MTIYYITTGTNDYKVEADSKEAAKEILDKTYEIGYNGEMSPEYSEFNYEDASPEPYPYNAFSTEPYHDCDPNVPYLEVIDFEIIHND